MPQPPSTTGPAAGWWNFLRALVPRKRPPADDGPRDPPTHLPVLLVVEGGNDVQFLRRLSRILHAGDERYPSLCDWEQAGLILCLPIGGNGPGRWIEQLNVLRKAELHIYDREAPPESARRAQALKTLPPRRGREVLLTSKRSVENYLHPQALLEAGGVQLKFTDQDPVAALVTRERFATQFPEADWNSLSERTCKRLREKTKRWLNREVVERMTPARLAERDPQGEVISWLQTLTRLVHGEF